MPASHRNASASPPTAEDAGKPLGVPVEVTCEMITALVDQGNVDEANSSNLDCVGKAIAAAARRGQDLT